ncbi:hypothetical protein [Brevundimonas sp. A19_0]|uniref:hypothetical protein n=1 Tax=Brevundimonas sp. A19_0 TaxID=2821087 RepID=UPI001ADB8BF7|nr:hypothetical protein [Brevundimonas sp. A19_0]MBO9500608.1 hypothetical protein [Brevundimonas sp. A19_0]
MSEPPNSIPPRFAIARRWQWVALAGASLAVITVFVAWPLGYLWPAAAALVAFLPSVWLFTLKCYRCGWPAFTDHAAEERLKQDQRFWTRFWGKDPGGVHLPLPRECTRCGAPFRS